MLVTYTKQVRDGVHLRSVLQQALNNAGYGTAKIEFVEVNGDDQITVSVTNAATSEIETIIKNTIATYVDPPVRDAALEFSKIRVNTIDAFSGTSVRSATDIDMQNHRLTSVAAPVEVTDAVNKQHVDALQGRSAIKRTGMLFDVVHDPAALYVNGSNQLSISSSALGTGLTGANGTPIDIASSLPHVTSIGPLNNLTVNGLITATTGLSANNSLIRQVAAPLIGTDAVNKTYVDNTLNMSAGDGITANGAVLSVSVDGSSLEIVNDRVRIASAGIGTGLLGGSGTQLSVNPQQPGIVSVGTLTNLAVSGPVLLSSTSDATSIATGALQISGGLSVTKSTYLSGSLFVGNEINVNGKRVRAVAVPDTNTDAANKAYVDGLVTVPGQGLGQTGTTLNVQLNPTFLSFSADNRIQIASTALSTGLSGGATLPISVNARLPHVVEVGTLETLNVSGPVTLTSTSATAVAISGGLTVSKAAKILSTLNMDGNRVLNVAAPTGALDGANKSYVDGMATIAGAGLTKTDATLAVAVDGTSIAIHNNALRLASGAVGTGLSGGSGVPISVNASQPQITSVGTLTALSVTGLLSALGGANMNGNKITGVGDPTLGTDAVNKGYTDSLLSIAGAGLNKLGTTLSVVVDGTSLEIVSNAVRVASGALGTGLSGGSGALISVNASQPQITTVGTLTGLTVSGTSNFGLIQGTRLDIPYSANENFLTGLRIISTGANNGNYIQSFNTRTSGNYEPLHFSDYSATSLKFSILTDRVHVPLTSATTSVTTGAFTVAGGVGISGALNLGGKITGTTAQFTEATVAAATGNAQYISSATSATGAAYYTLRTNNSANIATYYMTSTGEQRIEGGNGTLRIAQTALVTTTANATAVATGALQVSGGASFAGNVFASGKVLLPGADDALITRGSDTFTSGKLSGNGRWGLFMESATLNLGCAMGGASRRVAISAYNADSTYTEWFRVYGDTGVTQILSTTTSTSATTGALTIAGGVGISNSLFVGSAVTAGQMFINTLDVGATLANKQDTITAGTGLTKTGATLALKPAQSFTDLYVSNKTDLGGNGGLLSLLGTDHVYIQFYRTSTSGRTAFFGYQNATSQTLVLNTASPGNSQFDIVSSVNITGNLTGTTSVMTTSMRSPMIGVNTAPAYPDHILSSTASNVSLLRLAMPNLGSVDPISTSIVYGSDGLGTGDISGKISFIRLNSAANNRTAIAFSTSASAASGSDVTTERLRIGSDGEVSIYSTINSTSATTGALVVSGGVGIGQAVVVGGNGRFGSGVSLQSAGTTNTVSLTAPANIAASYTVSLPPAAPTVNESLMYTSTNGTSTFNLPFVSAIYSGTTLQRNCRIWTQTGSTSSGGVTGYPTTDNTTAGTALFSVILIATATARVNTTTARSVPFCCMQGTTSDLKSVVFRVVTGTTVGSLSSQDSVVNAPNGTLVQMLVIGY